MRKIQFYFILFASFFVFSVESFGKENTLIDTYKWIPRYLSSLDESTTIDEVVGFLFSVREMIINQGYSAPLLSELFSTSLEEIKTDSRIDLDEEFIEDFYHEILSGERTSLELISFDVFKGIEKPKIILIKKNKKSKMKISNGFAIAFCKALGGALLCIIPHPVTVGIGANLAASGIIDMVKHADDPDGITMEELDRQLRERQRIGAENMFFSPSNRCFRKLDYPVNI